MNRTIKKKLLNAVGLTALVTVCAVVPMLFTNAERAQAQAAFTPPIHSSVTKIAQVGKCDVYRISDEGHWVYLAMPTNGAQAECSMAH